MPRQLVAKVGWYALANGLPAVINFGGMVLLTHLLTPAEYGTYALVIATVAVANAIGFQWLRSGARRFLAVGPESRPTLLPTIGAVYFSLYAGSILLALSLLPFSLAPYSLVALGCGILGMQTWYELNSEIVLAEVNPRRYGIASLARAIIAVGLGTLLAWSGLGAPGVLVGALAGYALPGLMLTWRYWRGLGRFVPSRPVIGTLFAYAAPLTASYALQFVMDAGDRFLLRWLRDITAVGVYAVAYDLTQQTLTILMVVVNLAAFPMVVRALETDGYTAAAERLRVQVVLLALLVLPGAVGLSLLASRIGSTLLGASFSAAAGSLVPVIVIGAVCCGFKVFYFDLAYQLSKQTRPLIWIGLAGTILNIGLNLMWIPRSGPLGAAWATAATFAVVLVASAVFGRRRFVLPVPWMELGKVALVTVAMGAMVVICSRTLPVGPDLWLSILVGLITVVAGTLLFNLVGARNWLRRGLPTGAGQA